MEILRSFQLPYLLLKQRCAILYSILGPVGGLRALPDNDSSPQRPGARLFGLSGCSKWRTEHRTEHGFAQTRGCIVGNDKIFVIITNLMGVYLAAALYEWLKLGP